MIHVSTDEQIRQHDEVSLGPNDLVVICYGPLRFNINTGHRIGSLAGHLRLNGYSFHFRGINGVILFDNLPRSLHSASYNPWSGHVFLTLDKYQSVDNMTISYNFTDLSSVPLGNKVQAEEPTKWLKEGF